MDTSLGKSTLITKFPLTFGSSGMHHVLGIYNFIKDNSIFEWKYIFMDHLFGITLQANLIGQHILPCWDTHIDEIRRCEKSLIGCITWCVGLWMLQPVQMHTLPRTNSSILQLTWALIVVGVYKIYCSNIECLIIREVYRSPDSNVFLHDLWWIQMSAKWPSQAPPSEGVVIQWPPPASKGVVIMWPLPPHYKWYLHYLEKKESGTHVSVCLEVENLKHRLYNIYKV